MKYAKIVKLLLTEYNAVATYPNPYEQNALYEAVRIRATRLLKSKLPKYARMCIEEIRSCAEAESLKAQKRLERMVSQ